MKNKEIILSIMLFVFAFIAVKAWALSVTTTDGQTFTVINDQGVSTNWTNAQMLMAGASYASAMKNDKNMTTRDSQRYQQDSEGYFLLNIMENLAVNAAAQLNATVNGT
jgi:hypothetical protein